MTSENEKFDFLKITGSGRKKSGPDKKYATFNRRMIAGTIDSMLLALGAPLFDALIPINTGATQSYALDTGDPEVAQRMMMAMLTSHEFVISWVVNALAQALAFCVFSGVCWHFWSATPGKMICRIKVADAETEGKISTRQILLRLCGYFISTIFLMLGFIWIGIDKRRQGWHDKLAGTVVITIPWRKKKEEWA